MRWSLNFAWIGSVLLLLFLSLYFKPSAKSFLGFVDHNELIISSEIGGLVKKIHVRPGEHVESGDPIAELTDLDLEIQLNSAQQELSELLAEKKLGLSLANQGPRSGATPVDVRIKWVRKSIDLLNTKKQAQFIRAANKGVVGSIDVKEGQYVSAYQRLASVYGQDSNMVFGFVHESGLADVSVGEDVRVISLVDPRKKTVGKIVSVGGRFIPLPVRLQGQTLSQNPVFGREIQVMVEGEHQLLPSEKVNIARAKTPMSGFLSSFKSVFVSKESEKP